VYTTWTTRGGKPARVSLGKILVSTRNNRFQRGPQIVGTLSPLLSTILKRNGESSMPFPTLLSSSLPDSFCIYKGEIQKNLKGFCYFSAYSEVSVSKSRGCHEEDEAFKGVSLITSCG
jgi:hypothetical protein